MFAIIGIVVVFGCIIAGYLMEHGNLKVLMQPAEFVIIAGAAAGTVLVANPVSTLKEIVRGVGGVFRSSHYTSQRYVDLLKMVFELLNKARREGLVALETDVEEPEKSALLTKYPAFLKDRHAVNFLCDTMRMAISGGIEAFGLAQMLEKEVWRQPRSTPWRTRCRDWGSSQPCWVLSLRWERWAVRPKKLATKWPQHWSEPFWAFCCVTDCSVP